VISIPTAHSLLSDSPWQKSSGKNARHHAGINADRLSLGQTDERESNGEAETKGVYQKFIMPAQYWTP
jgi:hypothetical protein